MVVIIMPDSLNKLYLTENEKSAIREADQQLKANFPVEQVILFGSVARGEAEEGSDIDLLVLTHEEVSHRTRNMISDLIFEVNFKYHTNLSIVVVDSTSWKDGIISLTPLFNEVQRDGLYL